ncbi:MAG: glycosyltransferase [Candidatus Eisenbacteria bacterium]
MRAAQIITRRIVGGAQRIALETAAALRARGDECEIWCGPQTGPEGDLGGEARERGVPLRIVPDLVREVDPARDLRARSWLLREMRDGGFDVVHTHSSKAGILGRRAAHEARKRPAAGVPAPRAILHTVHGWGWSDRTAPAARVLFAALERAAFGWADRVVAVSERVREEGLRQGIGREEPDRYRVILPGIDTAPFRALLDAEAAASVRARSREALDIPADAVVAGTVGRLSSQKNPEAILALAARFPDLHLLLIGDGPLRANLERTIAQRGWSARVRMPGIRTDVAACLAALDLFVLPSLWEGLPLTILEARCAGLPVIASGVGGVSEAMPEPAAGWIVPPGDAGALERAVADWFGRRREAREAALAGRFDVLQKGSRSRMLEEILSLYDSLLGSPPLAR